MIANDHIVRKSNLEDAFERILNIYSTNSKLKRRALHRKIAMV